MMESNQPVEFQGSLFECSACHAAAAGDASKACVVCCCCAGRHSLVPAVMLPDGRCVDSSQPCIAAAVLKATTCVGNLALATSDPILLHSYATLNEPEAVKQYNPGCILQGDNVAKWEELYHSIAGVLNNNMWGIAMAGADICGFYDMDPEHHVWSPEHALPEAEYEELCNR
jgi:hypothetical protein